MLSMLMIRWQNRGHMFQQTINVFRLDRGFRNQIFEYVCCHLDLKKTNIPAAIRSFRVTGLTSRNEFSTEQPQQYLLVTGLEVKSHLGLGHSVRQLICEVNSKQTSCDPPILKKQTDTQSYRINPLGKISSILGIRNRMQKTIYLKLFTKLST